jgi:ferredoxin
MLKGLIVLSTLFSSISNNYIDVKSIECSSNINNNIEFVFYFDSDYVSYHEISVEFNLFRDNKNVANYNNSLTVIGEKRSVATMDYLYKENMYVLLTVYYENNKLVDHLRFDLKGNNSCSLDRNLKECNEFYKTVYDGKIIDRYSNIRILYFPFDSFLSMNYLDLSNLIIYSDYDFSDDFIYLEITRITGEYEFINEDNYKLLLEANSGAEVLGIDRDTQALERAAIPNHTRCRSGACGYCRCRLLSGEVYVPTLGDGRRLADKNHGYLHACSAWPLGDCVVEVPIV